MWVDGERTDIDYDNDLGLITIDIPNGEHSLEAKLTNTPIRNIGNTTSVVGLLAIPIYLKRKKDK